MPDPRGEAPRLENWSIVLDDSDPYQAPECRKTTLAGEVYGHPRLEDGKYVRTSTLRGFNADEMKAKTSNTIYSLGKPCPEFLKWLEGRGSKLTDYNKPF